MFVCFTLGEVSHKLPKFGFKPDQTSSTVQTSLNQFKLVQTKLKPIKTNQNQSEPVKWSGSQLWLFEADPFYFTLISKNTQQLVV